MYPSKRQKKKKVPEKHKNLNRHADADMYLYQAIVYRKAYMLELAKSFYMNDGKSEVAWKILINQEYRAFHGATPLEYLVNLPCYTGRFDVERMKYNRYEIEKLYGHLRTELDLVNSYGADFKKLRADPLASRQLFFSMVLTGHAHITIHKTVMRLFHAYYRHGYDVEPFRTTANTHSRNLRLAGLLKDPHPAPSFTPEPSSSSSSNSNTGAGLADEFTEGDAPSAPSQPPNSLLIKKGVKREREEVPDPRTIYTSYPVCFPRTSAK